MVVFNTCAVRENADNRLYGNLGHLAPVKAANPGMQIAVGGCLAQKDRGDDHREGAVGRRRLRHPQHRLAAGAAGAGAGAARRRRSRSSSRSRSSRRRCRPSASRRTPPGCRSRSGCNNTCTFCIVPALRGKEKDRRPGDDPRRGRGAGRRGRHRGHPARARTSTPTAWSSATGRRSASCCAPAARSRAWSGCGSPRRTRREFTDDVIAAMAETPERDAAAAHAAAVRLRPGAARRCAAPTGRRSTSASSTGSAPRCRTRRSPPTSSSASRARPRRTSQATLDVVREARFAGAFTFQYSKRPGTPAADAARPGAARRSSRSATSGWSRWSDEIAWEENKALVGRTRRADGRRGRGPQGRRHPPAVRPRRPTTGWCTSRRRRRSSRRGPATWSPSRSPTPPRTTWSPTARCSTSAAPAPATPGRPGRPSPPGSRSACRRSAYPRRCRTPRLPLIRRGDRTATAPSHSVQTQASSSTGRKRVSVPQSGQSRSSPRSISSSMNRP